MTHTGDATPVFLSSLAFFRLQLLIYLFAVYRYVFGGADAQANLVVAAGQNLDANVVADADCFVDLA